MSMRKKASQVHPIEEDQRELDVVEKGKEAGATAVDNNNDTIAKGLTTSDNDDKKIHAGAGPPPMLDGHHYVNPGKEDQMEIWGYRRHRVREVITWVFICLTVGLLRLVFHWKPNWFLKATHVTCSLADAEKILLEDMYHMTFVEVMKIKTKDGDNVPLSSVSRAASFHTGPDVTDDGQLILNLQMKGSCIGEVAPNTTTYSSSPPHPPHPSSSSSLLLSRDERAAAAAATALSNSHNALLRFFENKKIKYMWNGEKEHFAKLRGLEEDLSCVYFHEAQGLSYEDQVQRRVLYDLNAIVVRVTPVLVLLVTQVLNPFYCFQIFSVVLWFFDEYIYYASTILIISTVSITIEIIETRKMQKALKSTISSNSIVTVCRDTGQYEDIPSEDLVPGDIIEVPRHGCIMQCDAVLVTGNCIVNESMLTGESVPVTKTPVPNPKLTGTNRDILFNMKEHSRHTLFCGTHVIQTRFYGKQKVRAVIIRTGYATAKGELVRSILFPKPADFKFTQDAYKFIGVLAGISLIGMIYTLVIMISRGNNVSKIILRTLDLVTIVVPPALPAAMTAAIVLAQNRLKRNRIFCISPKTINTCGALNVVCFDKTGTLTEDGLDMWGVVPASDASFLPPVQNTRGELGRDKLMCGMAACHSLTIIEGTISGDPLDHKMFEATGWELEEPGEDTSKYDVFMPTVVRPPKPDIVMGSETLDSDQNIPFEVGIIRQFTFSSRLQRMSVIARTLGSKYFDLYAKGAPEMIASLCKPESVPVDFHEELIRYTQLGYRVIALAYRPLKLNYVKVQRVQREQVETGLTFLGLLVMENRLKPETTPIIKQLQDATIRTIMVTGDNMLTAMSVARDCGMIEASGKVILVTVLPSIGKQEPRIQWTYAEDVNKHVKEVTTDEHNTTAVTIDYSARFHFAITGKSWRLIRQHFPDIIPKLVVRGTIFARMSPEQKQQLVEMLQEVGYYVGMCGDGANDCGALKTAHAGISLSEAEASVASPFTSTEPNISCVPTVIREGRAALVTSFGVFKYMACYSLTQFSSVCILYWIGANLTDFTFLYIDLFLITSLGFTMANTHAFSDLVPRPPRVSLISFGPLLSMISQMFIILPIQFIVWIFTQNQPWFEPFIPNDDDDYECHEVTTVFLVSAFQYIILAVVFSKGAPYRKQMFTNRYFIVNLVICVLVSVYVTMYPFEWLRSLMELHMPQSLPFRALIVGVSIINFFLCFLLETFIIDSQFVRNIEDQRKKRNQLQEYISIEEELENDTSWPPVSKTSQSIADLLRLESVPTLDLDHDADGDDQRRSRYDSTGSYENAGFEYESNGNGGGGGDKVPSSPTSLKEFETPLLEAAAVIDGRKTDIDAPQFTVL